MFCMERGPTYARGFPLEHNARFVLASALYSQHLLFGFANPNLHIDASLQSQSITCGSPYLDMLQAKICNCNPGGSQVARLLPWQLRPIPVSTFQVN
jgi:hypothetical protein